MPARRARSCCRGGAYNSPQLLMLSGIGPADELRERGVTPLHDLPGVGRNLQDHAGVSVINLATQPVSMVDRLRWDRLIMSVMRWAMSRDGTVATHAGGQQWLVPLAARAGTA